jgi:hypothetical protein
LAGRYHFGVAGHELLAGIAETDLVLHNWLVAIRVSVLEELETASAGIELA